MNLTSFFTIINLLFFVPYAVSDTTNVDWELVLQQDGIEVYKGPVDQEGAFPFKAKATLEAPVQELIKVLFDYERKPQWAPKLSKVEMLEKVSNKSYIFTERYSTPWPASDRLFLLEGQVESEKAGHFLFKAKSTQRDNVKTDCCIVSNVKKVEVELNSLGQKKTSVLFTFHGHFGGWIPTWLSNLILKKWPYGFLKGIREQIASEKVRETNDYEMVSSLYPWLDSL